MSCGSTTVVMVRQMADHVNPNHAISFLSAYYICCIYSNALQTNFITETNTMNPDQTAPD